MIVLVCPGCKVRLTVGDDRAGETFECPKCDTGISVPLPAPSPPPPPASPPPAKARLAPPPPPPALPPPLPAAPSVPVAPPAEPCPFCGEMILWGARKCRHCGEFLDPELRRSASPAAWHPGVAAVLSLLIPGAGQMYKGTVGTGICWLVAVVVGYALLLIPGLVLHLLCVLHAASGNPRG